MPERLDSFPAFEKKKPTDRFLALLDGQIWKVPAEEYGEHYSSAKSFIGALKSVGFRQTPRVYLRVSITLNESVVVQRQPADYKPQRKFKNGKAGPKAIAS